jgi:hypothetical protein
MIFGFWISQNARPQGTTFGARQHDRVVGETKSVNIQTTLVRLWVTHEPYDIVDIQ